MRQLALNFEGPFAWVPSEDTELIFDAQVAENHGVYLWTVESVEGHLVWYVGQTMASFRKRMKDHFKEQMSGSYEVDDPLLLAQGERRRIWPGYYGKNEDERIPDFVDRMQGLAGSMVMVAKMTRFFLAPIDGDLRLHRRVEGGLGRYLREQPGVVGSLLSKQPRYDFPWREGEEELELRISSSTMILGLPDRLLFDERSRGL